MRPHQVAAGVAVLAACSVQFGWIRTLAAGLVLALVMFAVAGASRVAAVLAQTYTRAVAESLLRKSLDVLITIGSVLRRSGDAVDVAVEAMASLDEIAAERASRLRLVWEAIRLAVGAARTPRRTSTIAEPARDSDADADNLVAESGWGSAPVQVRDVYATLLEYDSRHRWAHGDRPDVVLMNDDGQLTFIEVKYRRGLNQDD